jgi:hypothetical protein
MLIGPPSIEDRPAEDRAPFKPTLWKFCLISTANSCDDFLTNSFFELKGALLYSEYFFLNFLVPAVASIEPICGYADVIVP